VEERRALCREIASGSTIELPRIRERERGPHWWRSLTLDPELLEAPWARPRPLRPRPDESAFRRAFEQAGLSDREIALLRVHANAPRRTATMRTLAREALGSNSYQSANSAFSFKFSVLPTVSPHLPKPVFRRFVNQEGPTD
jgi:hypothetical protein